MSALRRFWAWLTAPPPEPPRATILSFDEESREYRVEVGGVEYIAYLTPRTGGNARRASDGAQVWSSDPVSSALGLVVPDDYDRRERIAWAEARRKAKTENERLERYEAIGEPERDNDQ